MKYLHIIPPSKRMMDTYMGMIRKYFDINEHQFYFIRTCASGDRVLFEYGNVEEMRGKNRYEKAKNLYNTLNSAEHIIWHGFIYHNRILAFLLANPKFLKKSSWIMWGLDLYNWKLPATSFQNIFSNFLNYNCRKKMKRVIALVEQDKDCFYSQFSSKIPCDIIPLPLSANSFAQMDYYCQESSRPNGKTFVQVAHNAYSFNRHTEVLESLKKFKDQNLCLYLPMSYGSDYIGNHQEYIKKISTMLESTFPNKHHCLNQLMPITEYTNFLWNMDIAIFNAQRQNGLGNILRLLYMGNKVFLPSDGPLYDFFTDNGVIVYDTHSIPEMSYEEFIQKPDNSNSKKWIKENYHPDYNYKKWKEFFEKLDKCTMNSSIDSASIFANEQITIPHTPYKQNYLDVSLYTASKFIPCQNGKIYIIGADNFGCNCIQIIEDINRSKVIWSLQGILDENIDTLGRHYTEIDVVGKFSTWHFGDNEYAVCAIRQPSERKMLLEHKGEEIKFANLIHPYTSISNYSNIGIDCVIGAFTIIQEHSTIGNHTHIMGANIENNVQIGNYCNIGFNSIIKENSIIGNNVIIDDNIIIPENSVISDNSYIVNLERRN